MTVKDLKDLIKDAGLDDNTEITIMGKNWNLLTINYYGLQYSKKDGVLAKRIHVGT